MKVSGEVVSVKQKHGKRGPYFGILIVDDEKHRWWFPYDDTSSCPNKGDKIVVDGKEGETTDDGEMTFLKDVYIVENDVGCDHQFLERAGPTRYECQECGVKLNLS